MKIAMHTFDVTKCRAVPQGRSQVRQAFSRPFQKCPDMSAANNSIKRGQHATEFVKNITDQTVTPV